MKPFQTCERCHSVRRYDRNAGHCYSRSISLYCCNLMRFCANSEQCTFAQIWCFAPMIIYCWICLSVFVNTLALCCQYIYVDISVVTIPNFAMRYVSRYLGHDAIRIAILVYRVSQCLDLQFVYDGNAIYMPRCTLLSHHNRCRMCWSLTVA